MDLHFLDHADRMHARHSLSADAAVIHVHIGGQLRLVLI
jgi:hypothetical protein